MNVLTFGSCLSECITKSMLEKSEGSYLAKISNFRTDQFIDYVVDNKYRLLRMSELESLFIDYFDVRRMQFFKNVCLHQSNAFVEKFVSSIPQADLIVIDNHMDIGAKLVYNIHPEFPEAKFFIRVAPHFLEGNGSLKIMPLLDLAESSANFIKIIQWIRSINKSAFIFFVPYPGNPFFEAGAVVRGQRSKDFKISKPADRVFIFPYMYVPEKYQNKKKGPLYLTDDGYSILAHRIVQAINGIGTDIFSCCDKNISELELIV